MLSIEEKILTLNSLRFLPVAGLHFTFYAFYRCPSCRCTDTSDPGHFGPKTLQAYQSSDPGHFGMTEVSGHFGTGASVPSMPHLDDRKHLTTEITQYTFAAFNSNV